MKKYLNTVEIGDAFENRVYTKMKELLESDKLGLSPAHSKIFQKKKYVGKSGSTIVFDISIESYQPDSKEWSVLTLIECKDYSSTIQVEKIRDFVGRIQDVNGNKGYFVSTNKFQRGAHLYANQYKIGLARFAPLETEFEWKLRRIGGNYSVERQVLLDQLYVDSLPNDSSFIAICDYDYYSNFVEFFIEKICKAKTSVRLPFLPNAEIRTLVLDLVDRLEIDMTTKITSDSLVSIVKKGLGVQIIYDDIGLNLGYCNFSTNTICISSELEYDSPRWRFTLAHEIGHYMLHKSICTQQFVEVLLDQNIGLEDAINEKTTQRIEIQANIFASELLMPDLLFVRLYSIAYHDIGLKRFPSLYLDNQPCNIRDCNSLFYKMSDALNVSVEAVKIHLLNKKWLTINQSTKSSRDIIRSLY